MKHNFPAALQLVLKHEGGFVNHPSDPGGATNKGITIATYRRYIDRNGTVADLKRITNEQVATVYRRHYWDAVQGDALPSGLDYAVFDFGVNSGPRRSAKYLQGVLGVARDGKIGPATLAAASRVDVKATIRQLCADRMAYLRGLNTWRTFGKGWTKRVRGVEKHALEMAVSTRKPVKPSLPIPTPENAPTGFPALFMAIWQFVLRLFRKDT